MSGYETTTNGELGKPQNQPDATDLWCLRGTPGWRFARPSGHAKPSRRTCSKWSAVHTSLLALPVKRAAHVDSGRRVTRVADVAEGPDVVARAGTRWPDF